MTFIFEKIFQETWSGRGAARRGAAAATVAIVAVPAPVRPAGAGGGTPCLTDPPLLGVRAAASSRMRASSNPCSRGAGRTWRGSGSRCSRRCSSARSTHGGYVCGRGGHATGSAIVVVPLDLTLRPAAGHTRSRSGRPPRSSSTRDQAAGVTDFSSSGKHVSKSSSARAGRPPVAVVAALLVARRVSAPAAPSP